MTSFLSSVRRWAPVVLAIFSLVFTLTPAQSIRAADAPIQVFLPLVNKPPVGISGRVTFNGAPEPTVVWLCLKTSATGYECANLAATDSNGRYFFDSSLLTPGSIYDIDFNTAFESYSGKLSYWFTKDTDPYIAGTDVVVDTFDIADIPLISPIAGVSFTLPYTFRWTQRSAMPTDSYRVNLYKSGGGFQSAPLGYVNSYQLNSFPAGFTSDMASGWSVSVFGPNGGIGRSFYRNDFTFSASSNSFMTNQTNGVTHRYHTADAKYYTIP